MNVDVNSLLEAIETLSDILEEEIDARPYNTSRTMIEDKITSARHLIREIRLGREIQDGL